MIEPVAYKRIYDGGVVGYGNNKSNLSIKNIPLYTSDQLQNKIELTKDEFELMAKVCRGIQPFQKIEQHVKIVANMKWFVRSKKPNNDGSYLFRSGIKDFGDYYYTKDKNENTIAYQFDTKEEAEKWTNPLTEAVYLPVEEK